MTISHERIIEAGKAPRENIRDLARYRELFFFLIWKDLLVRYKQTVVGIGWSIIRPLLSMLAFTIVFGKLAKLPSNGIPYAVLVFSGLLPWQLFANGLSQSSDSIVANTNLVTKVYFPRMILPAVPVVIAFIDSLVPFLLLILLMFYYGMTPSWHIVFLPLFVVGTLLFSFGIGLWSSSTIVRYRDLRYAIPFLVQFGLYISPVGFTACLVPPAWRLLYSLNPMVGLINGFRWAVIGEQCLTWQDLAVSVTVVLVLLFTGVRRFKSLERYFPDNI